MNITVCDDTVMRLLGGKLALACRDDAVIYLRGELGAGKTTLVRGFIHGMGYRGTVKSPTYTLIEPYEAGERRIYHLDLYRVKDADELNYLALRDLAEDHAVMLVEWPERGTGLLPPADIVIDIEYLGSERRLRLVPQSPVGLTVLTALDVDFSSG